MRKEVEKKGGVFGEEVAVVLRRVQEIWQEIRESERMLAGVCRQEEEFAEFWSVDMSGEGAGGDSLGDFVFLSGAVGDVVMSGGGMADITDMVDMLDIESGSRDEVFGRILGGEAAKERSAMAKSMAHGAESVDIGEVESEVKNKVRNKVKNLDSWEDLGYSDYLGSGQKFFDAFFSVAAKAAGTTEALDDGDNSGVSGRGVGGISGGAADRFSGGGVDVISDMFSGFVGDFGDEGDFSEAVWGNDTIERQRYGTGDHGRAARSLETAENVEIAEAVEVVNGGKAANEASSLDMAEFGREVVDVLCDALCDELVVLLNSRSLV